MHGYAGCWIVAGRIGASRRVEASRRGEESRTGSTFTRRRFSATRTGGTRRARLAPDLAPPGALCPRERLRVRRRPARASVNLFTQIGYRNHAG